MEMQQVRYFVALAETLNFTRAAERCNVTQPALTRAIQQLEHELGGPLFNRERANSHLTELGRLMLPFLRQIWTQTAAAKEAAKATRRLENASLAIGAMCTIGPRLISSLIVRFQQAHPEIRINLMEDDAASIAERLEKGALDLALLSGPAADAAPFHQVALFEEAFRVLLPRNHRLCARETVRVADLHDEPYIARSNCEADDTISAGFDRQGSVPRTVFSSPRDEWVQSMVRAGLGFGLFPEHSITEPDIAVRPLIDPAFERTVSLVTVRGRPHAPAVGAFLSAARRHPWRESDAQDSQLVA